MRGSKEKSPLDAAVRFPVKYSALRPLPPPATPLCHGAENGTGKDTLKMIKAIEERIKL